MVTHISSATKQHERSSSLFRKGLALVFLAAGRLFPWWAGRLTFWAFCTPVQRRRIEHPLFAEAEAFTLPGDLRAWKWGDGPAVFLVHGWGGSSGQLLGWVPGLVERGFSVVAIDQAAHGSSPGLQTNAGRMAETLLTLSRRVGAPVAIVAHSLGGVVSHFAVAQGLRPEAVVLVSSPAAPELFYRRMLKFAGYRKRDELVRAVGRYLGRPFSDFVVGPALVDTPTLLVHDRGDREVALEHHHALGQAMPSASRMLTDGLGHNRILNDSTVINSGLRFIEEHVGELALHTRARSPYVGNEVPLFSAEELYADLVYGQV
jgi:pimeloyl-ACP methyl ester carboxylesterase